MATIQHNYTHSPAFEARRSMLTRLNEWLTRQEENRLLWLGLGLTSHSCIITPITIFFIIFSGNFMLLWAFAIAAITMTLIVNLAALPTRATVPTFFLSILIDLSIIITSISLGLHF